jgi:mannonate dehydratase
MRLALYLTSQTESFLRLGAQLGVTDIVAGRPQEDNGPVWDYMALVRLRKKVEDAGLRLSVIEGIGISDRIKIGLPGRDEDLDYFCQSLRNMGKAGIHIMCYNWMAAFNWMRTSVTTRTRGDALVTSYDHADMENAPLTEYGVVTEEQLWDSLDYFLKCVIPVAEEAGVKMAMHPDDPPLSPIRGIGRIMRSPENFQRLIDMYPNDYNGITFCQGNFAAMGVDMVPTIQHFGKQGKTFFVHFRDVKGTASKFEETFHDEGITDMAAAMRAHLELGYDVPVRPDHAPTMEGEENSRPGYMVNGRIFAIGYMKGLIHGLKQAKA